MNLLAVSNARLLNQRIHAKDGGSSAKNIVAWMGVIQAQDYAMACWVIGVRGSALTESTIQSALDRGEILRTHI